LDLLISILRGSLGIISMLGICYLFSISKKSVNWRLVLSGTLMQIILAILMIKIPFIRSIFGFIVDGFLVVISSTIAASQFLFGDLATEGGAFGFAFTVLPTVIFFSTLSSVLYYLGVLQKIVYGFAWVMSKTMRLSGSESLAAAANVFIGQTEAPLVVKPYLERMTKSEIMCLMTGGMATIAGGVFGAYLSVLGGDDPVQLQKFGLHLMTASIISAPAAIVTAKILFPETEPEKIDQNLNVSREDAGDNFLDAMARGTTDGVKLAVNVGAMLLAFMALIYLSNKFLFWIGELVNVNEMIVAASDGTFKGLSMQYVMGFFFAPIAWLVGVDSNDIMVIGQLLGEKTILNEFVAYFSLNDYKNLGVLSEKSIIIATYALCGFANFGSIGIQIGGISSLAPGQRKNLTELGFKALIGGTAATLMTGAIAGMLT